MLFKYGLGSHVVECSRIITSSNKVMFLLALVILSVCLSATLHHLHPKVHTIFITQLEMISLIHLPLTFKLFHYVSITFINRPVANQPKF